VHEASLALGLAVRTPARLRKNEAEHAAFASLCLDAAVVCAYGLILPLAMLAVPRLGCLNIHASLLPRWRGAAPIQAAILAGDEVTGVTIMRMDEGLDTGPMLLRETIAILPTTDAAMLHDALAEMGSRLILRALEEAPAPVPQPGEGATYAPKLNREDGLLDWGEDAAALDRRVRALNPWPGTYTLLKGEPLKILSARPEIDKGGIDKGGTGKDGPGTILDDRLLVACGTGALRLTRVQAPGRSALDAAAFLRGHPIAAGAKLG
jgi:methionyl-tRNA formyltransferase